MNAPTVVGLLVAVFGIGMSLSGAAAVLGVPIFLAGVVIGGVGEFRGTRGSRARE